MMPRISVTSQTELYEHGNTAYSTPKFSGNPTRTTRYPNSFTVYEREISINRPFRNDASLHKKKICSSSVAQLIQPTEIDTRRSITLFHPVPLLPFMHSTIDSELFAGHTSIEMTSNSQSPLSVKTDAVNMTPAVSQASATVQISTIMRTQPSTKPSPASVSVVAIVVPLAMTFLITLLVVIFYSRRKRNQKQKRASNWKRNEESSVSWFEAFEFPQTLRAFNEFSEQADFAIPMGPLCINNFAYENYDATAGEQINGTFSSKKSLGQEFNFKNKKSSEIYPVDNILTSQNHKIRI